VLTSQATNGSVTGPNSPAASTPGADPDPPSSAPDPAARPPGGGGVDDGDGRGVATGRDGTATVPPGVAATATEPAGRAVFEAPSLADVLGVALVGFRDGFGVAFAVGRAAGLAVGFAVGLAVAGAITTTAAGTTSVEVHAAPPAVTENV
jgi:hypothetical protein